ncbi:hypothetical protein [Halalkalibacterium halodurans]|nr:hypothetical protein [Halalkalibacterium halodurans]MED4174350.1 hypothetical protein [Halalkalibacterium halodurans]TPE68593.1 hypothetical protein AMD02_012975 [Halalkalibacterium halodurans]
MKTWVAVLSILGGIAGVVSGFLVTLGGSIFGEESMANDGATVFWLSFLAIILGFLSWKFKKIGGISLIAISIYGLFVNGLFFIFAFVFLMIAGILSFKIKPTSPKDVKIAN